MSLVFFLVNYECDACLPIDYNSVYSNSQIFLNLYLGFILLFAPGSSLDLAAELEFCH